MAATTSLSAGPPRSRGRLKIKKTPREVAADAWVTSGISIAQPRPPVKAFTVRFKNPLVKVDIVTGEVLAFRWPDVLVKNKKEKKKHEKSGLSGKNKKNRDNQQGRRGGVVAGHPGNTGRHRADQ